MHMNDWRGFHALAAGVLLMVSNKEGLDDEMHYLAMFYEKNKFFL